MHPLAYLIYQAALQSAYILDPNIDNELRQSVKREMDQALKEYLQLISINADGGPAKQLASENNREAAHLLLSYGASPVLTAMGADAAGDKDYVAFLERNYGVVFTERVRPDFPYDLSSNSSTMEALQSIPPEARGRVACDAAYLGYSSFSDQLTYDTTTSQFISLLAQRAAAGSHYRHAEQLWAERGADIRKIVEGTQKNSDFLNPVIALVTMSFMGDKFRQTFAAHLSKLKEIKYDIKSVATIADRIAGVMRSEGLDYEKALLLAVSQTETLPKYCSLRLAPHHGMELFSRARILALFKERLQLGDTHNALALMTQYSQFPDADLGEFVRELQPKDGIIKSQILLADVAFINCLFHPTSGFNFASPIDAEGNTIWHIYTEISLKKSPRIPPEARIGIDTPNIHGLTALVCAAQKGNADACDALIDSGASLTTPFSYPIAVAQGDEQKAAFIEPQLPIQVATGKAKQVFLEAYKKIWGRKIDQITRDRYDVPSFEPLVSFLNTTHEVDALFVLDSTGFRLGSTRNNEIRFAYHAILQMVEIMERHPDASIAEINSHIHWAIAYLQILARENKLIEAGKITPLSTAFDAFCKMIQERPDELLNKNPLLNTEFHQMAAKGNLQALNHPDLAKHLTSRNALGQTVLHVAAERGQQACCDYLISQGASITARMPDGRLPIELAIGGAAFLSLQNAYNDRAKTRERLAIHTLDSIGLIQAARLGLDIQNRDIKLLKLPALPKEISDLHAFISKHPDTPESDFAWQAITLIHHLLIEHQGSDTASFKEAVLAGIRHLEIVAATKQLFVIPLLFADATKDLIVAFEFFSYHLKTLPSNPYAVSSAAASASSAQSFDEDDDPESFEIKARRTPLHRFASEGKTDLLKRAILIGTVDINELNDQFESALHLAANYDHPDCCALLIEHGASTFLQNLHDQSAKDIAGSKAQAYFQSRQTAALSEQEIELKPMREITFSAAASSSGFFSPPVRMSNQVSSSAAASVVHERVELDPNGQSLFDSDGEVPPAPPLFEVQL